jgi:hypothetical protein
MLCGVVLCVWCCARRNKKMSQDLSALWDEFTKETEPTNTLHVFPTQQHLYTRIKHIKRVNKKIETKEIKAQTTTNQ